MTTTIAGVASIWNSGLTEEQIQAIAAALKPILGVKEQ